MENILILTGIILSALGIIGSIIPALPGPVLSYVSLFFLYFARGGEFISEKTLIITGILTAIVLFFVNFIPVATIKMTGASKFGLIGSLLGMFIGMFLFPPFGIFIGVIVGAMLGEFYAFKDTWKAVNAGFGTIIGLFFVIFIQTTFSSSVFIYIILKLFNI